ncbi:uncharacterized protein [Diadema setosum]|uniref:uncharacterized protein n=1 Tax=Diadema setosum TaxID=31175 RepID=UPI003B3BCA7A
MESATGDGDHLIRFGKAKEEQQLLYDKTDQLIECISVTLRSYTNTGIDTARYDGTISLQKGIIESLKFDNMRKKMKVSFFGGTSSGKTTTVNALLGRELLPSGMGDTTGCFVQVEGLREHGEHGPSLDVEDGPGMSQSTSVFEEQTPESSTTNRVNDAKMQPKEPGSAGLGTESLYGGAEIKVKSYYRFQKMERGEPEARLGLHEDQRHPLNVESLNSLVDVNSEETLDSSYILKIYLASNETTCTLLNHDLQLMDCPGITKCQELKELVSSFCADSDVHVFIINPKTIISPEEKKHFLEVGKRLPRPDVIVGFSQWDLSARERHPEKVKARHIDAVYGLLVDLGTVTTREEAEKRCFFFSGSEALDIALGETGYLLRGWEGRHDAFKNFVSKIKEQVTQTGMRAKLANGRRTCGEVLFECEQLLRSIDEEVEYGTKRTTGRISEVKKKQLVFSQEYNEFAQESESLKSKASEDIKQAVSSCLDEVRMTMARTLMPLMEDFQEDNIHLYAERAVRQWYERMLREFKRATQQVCETYSFDVLASYKEHFKAFEHDIPRAYLLPFVIQDSSHSSSTLPDSALLCSMTGVSESSVWASFASTRRRLSSMETDKERNALVRKLAAAAAVFFTRVRQWLRLSVENHLQNVAQSQMKALIPEEIKQSCSDSVKAFCDNASDYYRRQIRDSVEKELISQKRDEECRSNELEAFSSFISSLLRQTEAMQENLSSELRKGCGDDDLDNDEPERDGHNPPEDDEE